MTRKKIVEKRKVYLFEHETFDRGDISLVAKCFGHTILKQLKKDLSESSFSITIDSSTIARKYILALMVRYLKEYIKTLRASKGSLL